MNLLILTVCIVGLEGAARLYLGFRRGTSTAGLTQRIRHLRYQPFVMFGHDWEIRRRQALSALQGRNIYHVVLLGGSTAAAFPEGILEAALAELDDNIVVKVTNFAYGGYNARQEAIVAVLWVPDLQPDLIITIDGANDFINRIRMSNHHTFYLNNAYQLLLTKPFLAPVAEILRYSQLLHGLQRLKTRQTIKPAIAYQDCIPVYLSAMHSINALAKGLSAQRIMVLQPHMAFKEPLAPNERRFTAYAYREAVVKALYDEADAGLRRLSHRDDVLYLDGRHLYQGHAGQIFRDDVHFVDHTGYEVLATEIMRLVVAHGVFLSPLR